jgi:hypothetical protein
MSTMMIVLTAGLLFAAIGGAAFALTGGQSARTSRR